MRETTDGAEFDALAAPDAAGMSLRVSLARAALRQAAGLEGMAARCCAAVAPKKPACHSLAARIRDDSPR
ncbi:MAG: hypothetical protein JNK45_22245 [Myxococcales bacterium]|nr:hypothetical protein [Myxococcales bacterium]